MESFMDALRACICIGKVFTFFLKTYGRAM